MFLSLETMLSGVSLNLIVFSRMHKNYQGQILAVMVLTIAACEAAIALAMVVSMYRRKPTLDVEAWDELSDTLSNKPADGEWDGLGRGKIPTEKSYPPLVPAGLDPLEKPVPSSLQAAEETVKHSSGHSEVKQRV